jgi:hypothetical protein
MSGADAVLHLAPQTIVTDSIGDPIRLSCPDPGLAKHEPNRQLRGTAGAVVGSFFDLLKTELIGATTHAKTAEAKVAIFVYIQVFCNRQAGHCF